MDVHKNARLTANSRAELDAGCLRANRENSSPRLLAWTLEPDDIKLNRERFILMSSHSKPSRNGATDIWRMGLRKVLPKLRSPRRRTAHLATPLQLASTPRRHKATNTHQPTQLGRGQPIEPPHLERFYR